MGNNDLSRKQEKFGGFIKKTSTNWDSTTGQLLGAGNGFRFIESGIKAEVDPLPDESGSGCDTQYEPATGAQRHRGPLRMYAKYEDLEAMIGSPLGTAETPTQYTGTAYYSDFTINDIMSGVYYTMALRDGSTDGSGNQQIEEYPSVKFDELTLGGQMSQRMELSVGCQCRSKNINTTTGTNKHSTWASVTENTVRYAYLFNDGDPYLTRFYLNLQDGADFGAGDVVYPSSFEFKVSPNLTGDVTSQNSPYIDEPDTGDWRKITLQLTFPKTSAYTDWTRWAAGTAVKFKFVNSGPQIAATGYYYTYEIWIPGMKYVGVDEDRFGAGAGRGGKTLNFETYLCSAAPTGFPTGRTRTFIRMINTKTTAAF